MQLSLNKIFDKVNKEKFDKYLELVPDFRKEKTQKFTTVVLTLIAIIALSLFAINPTLSTIANLQKQLDDAKFVFGRLGEKINNLSILQTKYNELQFDLPVVFEAIPQNADVPKLTGQVQKVAQDSNVNLLSFQATEITSQNKFFSYTFSTTAMGNHTNILSFLTNLANMQRVLYIQIVNISQSNQEAGQEQITIRGQAFYKP